MINFEEEIEKFQPSLEVDEAEDAIYNNDVTDVTDIIQDILSEMKKNQEALVICTAQNVEKKCPFRQKLVTSVEWT